MRSRHEIELFSLSFLDLLFCGMAGMCLLLLIRDQEEHEPSPHLNLCLLEIRQVELDSQGKTSAAKPSGGAHIARIRLRPATSPTPPVNDFENKDPGDSGAAHTRTWIADTFEGRLPGLSIFALPQGNETYSLKMSAGPDAGSGELDIIFGTCGHVTNLSNIHRIDCTIRDYKSGYHWKSRFACELNAVRVTMLRSLGCLVPQPSSTLPADFGLYREHVHLCLTFRWAGKNLRFVRAFACDRKGAPLPNVRVF